MRVEMGCLHMNIWLFVLENVGTDATGKHQVNNFLLGYLLLLVPIKYHLVLNPAAMVHPLLMNCSDTPEPSNSFMLIAVVEMRGQQCVRSSEKWIHSVGIEVREINRRRPRWLRA